MDQVHLHLLASHLPIVGVIFGLLVMVAGYILRNKTILQTSLGIYILSALFAVPVFLTGEGAEHTIENIAGIEESFIEAHEDLGKIYIWVVSIVGLLALTTLFVEIRTSRPVKFLYILVLIGAIAAAAISKQLGTSGGEIRHTEIRTGAQQYPNPADAVTDDDD